VEYILTKVIKIISITFLGIKDGILKIGLLPFLNSNPLNPLNLIKFKSITIFMKGPLEDNAH